MQPNILVLLHFLFVEKKSATFSSQHPNAESPSVRSDDGVFVALPSRLLSHALPLGLRRRHLSDHVLRLLHQHVRQRLLTRGPEHGSLRGHREAVRIRALAKLSESLDDMHRHLGDRVPDVHPAPGSRNF